MDDTGVIGLLEEISVIVENAKPVFRQPNLRQVDMNEIMEVLDEMKEAFPSELYDARQIVKNREDLLLEAQMEADRIIEDARAQAMTIASDQEITRIAKQQANQITLEAQELARDMRTGADEYANEIFSHVENSLGNAIENVRRNRDRLNAMTQQNPR